MKIKHKVVKEFQYLSPDKKIFVLKPGTVLEEYNYKVKSEVIPIDKEIIDNNPEFFETIDWKAELMSYMKANKMPQPAQLGKKLIPFIEEMVLSSMQPVQAPADDSKSRELESLAQELSSREKRIKDKEEEAEIRLKRVEKREAEYKEDLKGLDKKESDIRERSKELAEKSLDIEDRMQDLNEKERNLDRAALDYSKTDEKYSELQKKIDEDLKVLSDRERELEKKAKEIAERESAAQSAGVSRQAIECVEDIEDAAALIDSVFREVEEFRQVYQGYSIEAIEFRLGSISQDMRNASASVRKKMEEALKALGEK